jgi:hypothetical protein
VDRLERWVVMQAPTGRPPPSTLPRMAVSGHSVTQSMQPVQFSVMYLGISGAM